MSEQETSGAVNQWTNPNAYPIAAVATFEGFTKVLDEENFARRVLPVLGVTATHSNYEDAADKKRIALTTDGDELEAYAAAALELAYAEDKAFEAQRRDRKTGLLDADAWFGQLEAALARARATGGRVAVILFDLDGFKNANKALGHVGGDLVIKDVANILLHKVRNGHKLSGRLGGDEFGVIMELPARGAGDTVAQRRRTVGAGLEEDAEMSLAVGRMNTNVEDVVEEMNRVFAPRNVPLLGVSRGAVLVMPDMTGDQAVIEADRLVGLEKDANIDKVLAGLEEQDRLTAISYMVWLVSKGIVDRRQLPLKKSDLGEE